MNNGKLRMMVMVVLKNSNSNYSLDALIIMQLAQS